MTNSTDCSTAVLVATFFNVFLEMIVVNVLIFLFTLWRIYIAREYLWEHKIFIIYFASLLVGNIISFVIAGIGINNLEDIPGVTYIINLLSTIGVSTFQIFFTLVPNYYFAVMKTKLNTVKITTTHKYFILNLLISAIFIVFMIITCLVWTFIVPNVLQLIEVIYLIAFYCMSLWKVRNIERKSKKKLWSFFKYYLLFVTVTISGNVARVSDVEGNYLTGIHLLDMMIMLLVVILTLKQMKLHKRGEQSQSSSRSDKKIPSYGDNNTK